MGNQNKNTSSRQTELRVHMVRNGLTFEMIGSGAGVSGTAANHSLCNSLMCPKHTRDAAVSLGIPFDLLPPETMSKAELLAERDALRVENSQLKARLAGYGQAA